MREAAYEALYGKGSGFTAAGFELTNVKVLATGLGEVFLPPTGFGSRGIDVDSKGVAWTVLASGHMASFDRKLCKGPMDGAKALTGAVLVALGHECAGLMTPEDDLARELLDAGEATGERVAIDELRELIWAEQQK